MRRHWLGVLRRPGKNSAISPLMARTLLRRRPVAGKSKEGEMRKTMGARGLLGIALVVLAGCGGGKSSSTTGATVAQSVKRLEVTVVGSGTAAAPGTWPFLAWAKELLSWARDAEAAVCSVSAGGQIVPTDAGGKATLVNVPVVNGNILVTINCNGVVSTVNISATPGTV